MPTPRKSTAQKKLEGNPGKRPMNNAEPEYAAVMVDAKPPAVLKSADAKKIWAGLLPALAQSGVLQETDLQLMTRYCQMWGKWVEVEGMLSNIEAVGRPIEKYITVTTNGNVIQNPLIGISNMLSDKLLQLEREMGLTPLARQRMISPPKRAEHDDTAKLTGMLSGPPTPQVIAKPKKKRSKRKRSSG